MSRKNSFCPYSHRYIGKAVQARNQLDDIMTNKPFVMAMVEIDMVNSLHEFVQNSTHKKIGDEKLLSDKYWTRIETYALNELLGRPVPNVINLNYMLDEARYGRFTRLDKILGFVDNEGTEMASLQQQMKMNDIMINILEAKGIDFYSYIERIFIEIYEETRIEKKQKISKMKLKNQRKLGAVTKTVPPKSTEVETEEKGSRKIKTAKDHEHYRKSKRPARL